MSRSAGYTLVEVLTAIAVLGFVLSALAMGSRLVASEVERASQRLFEARQYAGVRQVLTDLASASPQRIVVAGDETSVMFECVNGERCEAKLAPGALTVTIGKVSMISPLAASKPRFSYVSSMTERSTWSGQRLGEQLRGVALTDEEQGEILAYLPVKQTEPSDCIYDFVIRACGRTAAK